MPFSWFNYLHRHFFLLLCWNAFSRSNVWISTCTSLYFRFYFMSLKLYQSKWIFSYSFLKCLTSKYMINYNLNMYLEVHWYFSLLYNMQKSRSSSNAHLTVGWLVTTKTKREIGPRSPRRDLASIPRLRSLTFRVRSNILVSRSSRARY